MRKLPASLLLGFSLLGPMTPIARAGAPAGAQIRKPAPAATLSESAFALDLQARLGDAKKNLIWSPLSVDAALSMVLEGARGTTTDAMLRAMHLSGPPDAARRQAIVKAVTTADLQGAFGAWIQRDYPLEKAFVDTIAQGYQAKVATPDFKHDYEGARADVNDWIKKQTHGKIAELIPKGALDVYTRFVLADAITFKGKWLTAFDKKDTREAPFFAAGGEKKAKLMFVDGHFGARDLPDARIVALPYQGGALEMVIIVPKAKDGLAALEKSLTPATLDGWIQSLPGSQTAATVYLPRFKIQTAAALIPMLSDMGMGELFDDKSADLTGIANPAKTGAPLYVSGVFHQATIDVDEEGTEASAATGIVGAEPSSVTIPLEVRADRPFLYLIRDRRTNAIAFMGHVADPTI